MKFVSIIFVTFCLASIRCSAEEVVLPAVDGMVLHLGNYAQTVKVRAMSIGSPVCGMEFSIANRTITFAAVAGTWSDWFDASPALIGSSEKILHLKPYCQTGALAQVKYSK